MKKIHSSVILAFACMLFTTAKAQLVLHNGSDMAHAIDAGVLPPGGTVFSDLQDNSSFVFSNIIGEPSAEVYYTFTIGNNCTVDVSHCGSSIDSYVHLLDASGNVITSNNDNGPLCVGTSASLSVPLTAGTYYVVSEGAGFTTGNILTSISINTSGSGTPPGFSFINAIDAGASGGCRGINLTDTRNNDSSNGYTDQIGLGGNDVFYTFTISSATTVSISTCGSAIDTYIHLLDASGTEFASNDDNGPLCVGTSASIQMLLFPGTYFLVCEGNGIATGNIVTTITTPPLMVPPGSSRANAVDLGTLNSGRPLVNSYTATDCYEPFGVDLYQIYYKFTITGTSQVSISNCGSVNSGYYVNLLDAGGNLVNSTAMTGPLCSGSQASLVQTLNSGTYYLGIPGYLFSDPIVTTISAKDISACSPLGSSPSNDQSYVITYTPRIPISFDSQLPSSTVCEVTQDIQYIDGLGRPLQTVQAKASPAMNDLVQPFAYDAMGREAIKYLPYATGSGTTGAYRPGALSGGGSYFGSEQYQFYQNNGQTITPITGNPYSQSVYELTPDGRVVEQGGPGSTWQVGGGHTSLAGYGSNTTGDQINLWVVNTNGASTTTNYAAASLFALTTTDENGNSKTEFKDQDGRLICKKVQYGPSAATYTYYIYDEKGNLRYVVPPVPGTTLTSFLESDNVFDNFLYAYHYDGKNRVIEKKIPGKGWDLLVYNKLNQVVLSQSPAQQILGVWLFSKYDSNGRVVMTGDYASTDTRANLQSSADAWPYVFSERFDNGTSNFGYTNVCYPNISGGANKVLSVTYYDNYSFLSNATINPNSSIFTAPPSAIDTIYQAPSGAVTGTLTNVVGASSPKYLLGISYYDTNDRVVKTIAQNYIQNTANGGQYDIVENQYSFNGDLVKSTRSHFLSGSSGSQLTIIETKDLDIRARVKALKQQYLTPSTIGPVITLAKYDYNEVGQLITKHLHGIGVNPAASSFLQHIDYRYNSRGWLNRINDPGNLSDESFPTQTDAFAEQIDYDQPNSSYSGTTPQYNGNISSISWQTLVNPNIVLPQEIQGYVFGYDGMNQLTRASFKANSGNGQFDEAATYDELGNILTLNRKSAVANVLNDLTYDYGTGSLRGNRLLGVMDAGSEGYSVNFGYNANGSVTTNSKAGTIITYNELNLPAQINFAGGKSISFFYNSAGEKLERIISQGGSILEDRSYVGGIEYQANAIDFVHTPEGRSRPTGGGYVLEYNITDHLGNVRAMVGDLNGNGLFTANDIVQTSNYYPFGRQITYQQANPVNEYKYNGKEFLSDINAYDYGARYYDATIARWNGVDNAAEASRRWSPYSYVTNNPARKTDPDGNMGIDWQTSYANAVSSFVPSFNQSMNALSANIAGFAMDQYAVEHGQFTRAEWDRAFITPFSNHVMHQYTDWMKSYGSSSEGTGGVWGSGGSSSSSMDWIGLDNLLLSFTPFGGAVGFTHAAASGDVGGAVLGLASSAAFFTGISEAEPAAASYIDGKGIVGAAESQVARTNIALGLKNDLNNFSSTMGFSNYRDFATGGFTEQISKIQSAIANPNYNLHFNTTDFSRGWYLHYDPTKPVNHGNITNWELYTIQNTPGALDRTTFYKYENNIYIPFPFRIPKL